MNTASWEQIKSILRSLSKALVGSIASVKKIAEDAKDKADRAEKDVANKISGKMDAHNPVGTGAFSVGRLRNSQVGEYSCAIGANVTASGMYSQATGSVTQATGKYSHAEGEYSVASGTHSHAEGKSTTASGAYSHAEGINTIASGPYSHTEGNGTEASGTHGHAEGEETAAIGMRSHAEGYLSEARGNCSHAEGLGTVARDYQHVQGKCNVVDSSGKYAHIVGNGKYDSSNNTYERSNAHTLDWDGNAWYAGDILLGGDGQDAPELSVRKAISGTYERIETFTLETETSQIDRSETAAGMAYNFKALIIKAKIGAVDTLPSEGARRVRVSVHDKYGAAMSSGEVSPLFSTSSESFFFAKIDNAYGIYVTEWAVYSDSSFTGTSYLNRSVNAFDSALTNMGKSIGKIRIKSYGDVVIPAGSTFEVWGVWA